MINFFGGGQPSPTGCKEGVVKGEVSEETEQSGGSREIEVFVVSFVVEEVPLASLIVRERAFPVIGVGKSFGSGAEERIALDEPQGTSPDDFADITTLGPAGF